MLMPRKPSVQEDENFLNAARSIFVRIMELSVTTDKGIFWESITNRGGPEEMIVEVREDLYAGNAGIILYLFELYRFTGQETVKQAMENALDWLIDHCDHSLPRSFAFYTGRSGVAYLLIKICHHFKEDKYRQAAKRCMRQSNDLYRKDTYASGDDLINGSAGLLLANLQMYAYTEEKEYLEELDFIVSCLIERINYGKAGVYWNRLRTQISGLCGFSHGAAGVGWVLAELGHYFSIPFFNSIAEQTIYYEDLFFRKEEKNWEELRMYINPDELSNEYIRQYDERKKDMFSDIPPMHAWCHGAAGIGMARLRLYEIGGSRKFKQQGKIALSSTIAYCDRVVQSDSLYTLCHGVCGSAYLLLRWYRSTRDPALLEKLRTYGLQAIEQKKNKGYYILEYKPEKEKDLGLFNGLSGIGYFYLQCFAPLDPELDILQPVMKGSKAGKWTFTRGNQQMLHTVFPRLLKLMREHFSAVDPGSININYNSSSLRKELVRSMKELVTPFLSRKDLADALKYEVKVLLRNKAGVNNSALFAYNFLKHRMAYQFTEAQLTASLQLCCCSSCSLVRSDFDWTSNEEDHITHSKVGHVANYTVLQQTHLGVTEIPINTLESIVFKLFLEKGTVNEVVNMIREKYALDEEGRDFEKAIYEAIFSMIKNGILVMREYFAAP